MKRLEIFFSLIKIPVDFGLAILAFISAYELRSITDLIPGIQLPLSLETFPEFHTYLNYSAISSLVLILLLSVNKAYSLKNRPNLSKQLSQIWAYSTFWLFLIISYYFLAKTFPFSRLALIFTWLLCLFFLSFGRVTLHFFKKTLFKKNLGRKRLLFIGNNKITQFLSKTLAQNPEYECVGYIDQQNNDLKTLKFLGDFKKLEKIVKNFNIDEIIQTSSNLNQTQTIELRDFCREKHLDFSFVPDLLEVQRTNVEVETINGIPIIKLKPTPLEGWGRVIKRIFDLFGSLFGIIFLSPVFLICGLLVKLDDPKGTIIYKYLDDGKRVKRVGEKGKLFTFYKFRTMVPNSHNLRYTVLAKKNLRGSQWNEKSPLIKIKDDPRCTKIGKILRKYSLDELPQLFNVLKGEMSLVGPRPHLPEEVAKYQKHHKFVLTIKPGITGLAQIGGRSDLDFEKEVKLDTYYIEKWNIWMDIKIILKTLVVVFKKYEE